ncbi:MAG: DUF732 domain-containing protein [Acidimicrobiales bacterium]
MRDRDKATRLAAVAASVAISVGTVSCGSSVPPAAVRQQDQEFLASVHGTAPDVGNYRSDIQLVRLGHAACDGFRAGASYQQLADRLPLTEGANPLPPEDLGAVVTAAVDAFCPQFRSLVS